MTVSRRPIPLRLIVYDDACRGRTPRTGLTFAWLAGARLWRALGRSDLAFGARSWPAALRWLAHAGAPRPVGEIQFWMHGRWGLVRIGAEDLDARAFAAGHRLAPLLAAVRARLAGPDALVWFRTCETFGARAGRDFARAAADFFRCRVAGHTHEIALWQSGCHVLAPGETPGWDTAEGLAGGTPEAPLRALRSAPGRPATVSFLAASSRTKVGAGRLF